MTLVYGRHAMNVAYALHVEVCRRYDDVLDPEVVIDPAMVARPFGRPLAMPPHRWTVSWDVMQSLTEASPPPYPADNPKTAQGLTKLLFGWPIDVDKDAPAGTMRLEPAP